MTVSVSQLGAAQLQTTAAAIFTVPPGTAQVRIDKATFTNCDASNAHTITVYLVPAGQAVGASNTVIASQSIAESACYVSAELPGHVLASGDSLQALADTANEVTAIVSGTSVA